MVVTNGVLSRNPKHHRRCSQKHRFSNFQRLFFALRTTTASPATLNGRMRKESFMWCRVGRSRRYLKIQESRLTPSLLFLILLKTFLLWHHDRNAFKET